MAVMIQPMFSANCVKNRPIDARYPINQIEENMSTSPFFEVWIIFGRVVVGGVFVIAGSLKIKAGSLWFHKTLLAYDLMHEHIALRLSKSLPWAEAACGALL
ncbi:MAG: hypothetical protein HGA55_08145, partial [Methanoregulaceae archaeon]|nr:hypothetical protein [Methanoregulaceae archaeon]